MLIDVGRVVANKYELIRLLGRGSMGEVWVAHHKTLGEHVALKLLTRASREESARFGLGPSALAEGNQPLASLGGIDSIEDRKTAAARFLFEAQVAARLSRKTRHIVRVTDHGEEDGLAYIVMELLEGETLEQRLARDGPQRPEMVGQLVWQIARALGQAHAEGVVHRDLKPANVFLMRDEEGGMLVKLLDFGIARAIHSHRLGNAFATARGLVFGTPGYMSPEQARASSKLDHRCDLWALATMTYEALCGALPVAGEDAEEIIKNLCAGRIKPLRERRPDLSAAYSSFFDKAFADSIEERFASAAEMAAAFEQGLSLSRAPGERLERQDWAERSEPSPPAIVQAPGVPSTQDVARQSARLRRDIRARWSVTVAAFLAAVVVAAGLWRALGGAAGAAPRGAAAGSHSVDQPQKAVVFSNHAPTMSAGAKTTVVAREDKKPNDTPTIPVSALPLAEPLPPTRIERGAGGAADVPPPMPARARNAIGDTSTPVPPAMAPTTTLPSPAPPLAAPAVETAWPAPPSAPRGSSPQKPTDRSEVF